MGLITIMALVINIKIGRTNAKVRCVGNLDHDFVNWVRKHDEWVIAAYETHISD